MDRETTGPETTSDKPEKSRSSIEIIEETIAMLHKYQLDRMADFRVWLRDRTPTK